MRMDAVVNLMNHRGGANDFFLSFNVSAFIYMPTPKHYNNNIMSHSTSKHRRG